MDLQEVPINEGLIDAVWSVTRLRMRLREKAVVTGKGMAAYLVIAGFDWPPTRSNRLGFFYLPPPFNDREKYHREMCPASRTGITVGEIWIRNFLEENPDIKSKVVKYLLMRS